MVGGNHELGIDLADDDRYRLHPIDGSCNDASE